MPKAKSQPPSGKQSKRATRKKAVKKEGKCRFEVLARAAQDANGWDDTELADALCLPRSTLLSKFRTHQEWEALGFKTAAALAAVLDISLEELLRLFTEDPTEFAGIKSFLDWFFTLHKVPLAPSAINPFLSDLGRIMSRRLADRWEKELGTQTIGEILDVMFGSRIQMSHECITVLADYVSHKNKSDWPTVADLLKINRQTWRLQAPPQFWSKGQQSDASAQ